MKTVVAGANVVNAVLSSATGAMLTQIPRLATRYIERRGYEDRGGIG